MKSVKRLRSVAHSIAHHSISGLCYLHPHLGEACKKDSIKSIKFNLLQFNFEPELLSISKELSLSSLALHEKFSELLIGKNIEVLYIEKASAIFNFSVNYNLDSCRVNIVITGDSEITIIVDRNGKTIPL